MPRTLTRYLNLDASGRICLPQFYLDGVEPNTRLIFTIHHPSRRSLLIFTSNEWLEIRKLLSGGLLGNKKWILGFSIEAGIRSRNRVAVPAMHRAFLGPTKMLEWVELDIGVELVPYQGSLSTINVAGGI